MQDASEFLQHLLEVMSRAEQAAGPRVVPAGEAPTARTFDMAVESRVQCGQTGCLSYTTETGNVWSLGIPMAAMTNRAELEASQARPAVRHSAQCAAL